MKRKNNLSKNLRTYQEFRGYTQAELSRELGVPKSTLQSVLSDGNTTLETLIHFAEALNISLDELVYEQRMPEICARIRCLMHEFEWYSDLSPEQQEAAWFHVSELIRIMKQDEDR